MFGGKGFLILLSTLLLFPVAASVSEAAEDCLTCHETLAKGKVVHPALQMGCTTCHTAIDAGEVPHKKTNGIAKGLSEEQPGLCYGCHDKSKFTGKGVHPAIGMGCTVCHNPHSSKNAKLLVSEPPDLCYTCHDKAKFSGRSIHAPVGIGMCLSCHSPHRSDNAKLLVSVPPDLCYNCHDKAAFTKKNVHAPVAAGMCLSCHRPHASESIPLLSKEPFDLCLGCHADVRKAPHAVAGFSAAGHPIGELRKGRKKPLQDPARPGKIFYCGSCHNPHSSDWPRLYRYEARSSFELCQRCHSM